MFKGIIEKSNWLISKFRDDMVNRELENNRIKTKPPVQYKTANGGIGYGNMFNDKFIEFYNMSEDEKLTRFPIKDKGIDNEKLYECYNEIVEKYTDKSYFMITLIISLTSLFISLLSIIIAVFGIVCSFR